MNPEELREYQKKYHEKYHQDNRERLQKINNENTRLRCLGTTKLVQGKAVFIRGLNKRPYPNHCEVCGRNETRLIYHHWDNNNPSLGIWICKKCDYLAEASDNNGVEALDDNGYSKRYKRTHEDNPEWRRLAAVYLKLKEQVIQNAIPMVVSQ